MARRKKQNNGNEKKRKLLGVLLILLALLLLISLLTHSAWDDRMLTRADNPFSIDFRNQVGTVGAISSYYIYFFFGWLSLFIPGIITIPALKLFKWKWRTNLIPAFWVAMVISVFITMITNVYKLPTLEYSTGAAGASGRYIFYYATKLVMKIFGTTGSVILLGAGIVAGLIWLGYTYPMLRKALGVGTKISWKNIFGKIWGFLKGILVISKDRPQSKIVHERQSRKKAVEKTEIETYESNNEAEIIEQPDKIIEEKPSRKTLKFEKKPAVIGRETKDFVFPNLSLLKDDPISGPLVSETELSLTANELRETLKTFNVSIQGQIEIKPGPVITRFEFKPAAGIKVNQIVNLSDDLALALKAKRIRIVAPIPGKAAVGIEIPNRKARTVYLKDIVNSDEYSTSNMELPLALGMTISGRPFVTDLAKMPHLLVAGATNSGKSVCINTMITSLLYRMHPQEIKLILIDPKMLELSVYAGIPHLGRPVITNPKRAEKVLSDAVTEMQTRYEKLAKAGVRNIVDYNTGQKDEAEKIPYIVVIVDELADMMISAGSTQIEEKLTRLAQMARAVGIHLILATQRPSVDVITGLIKANFPARMAFHVASKTDSRTILDGNGAEKLLGNGDMLFLQPGQPEAVRLHGALISGSETQAVVKFINDQFPVEEPTVNEETTGEDKTEFEDIDLGDPLFLEAVKTVIQNKQGSVSLLQRKLGIGYQRAARLIDQLEEAGVVAEYGGSKARDVLVDETFIERLLAARSLSDSN